MVKRAMRGEKRPEKKEKAKKKAISTFQQIIKDAFFKKPFLINLFLKDLAPGRSK